MLLVPSLVLFLSFSLSSPSVIGYRDDERWMESVIPKLHIDTCVPQSTDGHCVPQIVVTDFLDVGAMVIVPRRVRSIGKPQDDEGTTLWVGTNKHHEGCMPAITIVGRAPVMLHNCSSKVLDYDPLLCSPPDLNTITVDYFVPTMDLHQLNCTTLIYTPFGYDANGRGIWSSMEAELYVSRAPIDWYDQCLASGGMYVDNAIIGSSCLYHYSSHLKDDPSPGRSFVVTGHHHKAKAMKEILFGGFGLVGFVCLWYLSLCFFGRLKTWILCWRKRSSHDKKMEVLLGKVEKLVPARYSYSDVERITSCFSHKLGQGGFGVVYKGKLPDGRPVAVKVMKDCKGSVKDFFTEVIAIGCTYHVNIVSLLGFCSEGPKQVLIYQFMSNGSLEKYIHDARQATSTLDATKLLRIAIGVARGLEYLHHGCNVGIVHFDIKPQNILLDEEFCPKIADFGLAKLCRSAEGIIKMLGARGTVGYIAPEVFSRCYGGVSPKSDVYSYGMMILEMVGGRKKCTAQEEERTSEIHLPHWVCKHLDSDGNLRSFRAMTEVEEEMARRMVLVGLWCIQTRPSDRPSMTKVLDMLEGRITELQAPPMPVLTSPPASTMHSIAAAQSQKMVSVVTS